MRVQNYARIRATSLATTALIKIGNEIRVKSATFKLLFRARCRGEWRENEIARELSL